MKVGKILALVLICSLLMSLLVACSGPGDIELPIGHRYGNPEVSYADGEITIQYLCVDCDYTATETRTVSTQVADAAAWSEAFGNLNMSNYSLSIGTTDGEITTTKYCVISDNRGYYASVEPEALQSSGECYTLQKGDESFITYVIDAEGTRLAEETDNRYWVQMKKESSLYLALEDQFHQFTYDAGSGSYISTAPMDLELFGFDGESLDVTTFESVTVNVADGSICRICAGYTMVDEYLQEMQIDICFYNIGFSVVKVPQAVIDAVSNTTKDPIDYFTYEIKNGAATITAVDPAISGEVAIPAAVGEYPVVAIGENAFMNCNALTGITIPASITAIGDNAFLGCEKLTSVTYAGTENQWAEVTVGQAGNEVLLGATIQFYTECVHNYDEGTVTKAPTCGAAGIKTYTCALCGSEKTEVVTATLGHSYDEGVIIEAATCVDAGVKVYTCTECGKNKTEYVPKLETHTYTNGTCIHCGADDPMYSPETDEGGFKPEGSLGTIFTLIESILELFAYFKQ